MRRDCDMTSEFNKLSTNGDRIRSMNDDELERFLWRFKLGDVARESMFVITRKKLAEWLKEPVKKN